METLLGKITALEQVSHDLDQLTVNDYPSGIGISPHIDSHRSFGECIAILVSAVLSYP